MNSSLLTTLLLSTLSSFLPCPVNAGGKSIPTIHFRQYKLEPGPIQLQTKSSLEIGLKIIGLSDIYQYPDLFAFDLEAIHPENDFARATLENMYPRGPLEKSWENPFTRPDGLEQLLICEVKVTNQTGHILRMRDAKVYLIVEGREPVEALSHFDQLLQAASHFEVATNQYLAEQSEKNAKKLLGGFLTVKGAARQVPSGFFREVVLYHRGTYKLVNSLDKELLPGFSLEGQLIFPFVATSDRPAKVAFFDIITQTDAAGNPIEKSLFEFTLQPQHLSMWYDSEAMMWREGLPP